MVSRYVDTGFSELHAQPAVSGTQARSSSPRVELWSRTTSEQPRHDVAAVSSFAQPGEQARKGAVDEVVRPRQFERDDSKCSLASIRTVHRVSRSTPPSQRRSPTRRSRTCARVHPSTSDSGISNAGNDDVLASRSTGMSDAMCEYSTMSCHPSACSRASRRTPSWLNPARSATCRDAAFVVECCSSTRRSPMLCAHIVAATHAREATPRPRPSGSTQ